MREFEERAEEMGWRSMVKDAVRFAEELGIELNFGHPRTVKTELRLRACQETHTSLESKAWCRLCGKAPERVAHILSGCGALQSK